MWRHEINVETTISMNLCALHAATLLFSHLFFLLSLSHTKLSTMTTKTTTILDIYENKQEPRVVHWNLKWIFSAAASFCYNIILPSYRHIKHKICFNAWRGESLSTWGNDDDNLIKLFPTLDKLRKWIQIITHAHVEGWWQ